MCMGDFNSPLNTSEKLGGINEFSKSMQDLLNFINTYDLLDVDLQGNPFTWANNKKD